MDWENDIHARSARLRDISRQLRADAAAARSNLTRFTRQNPRRPEPTPAPELASVAASDPPPTEPHDAAMETLRAIRSMLDTFPLEWQVAIVKALTARTFVKANERLRPPTALSA